jgi:hypothetical protein
MLGKLRQWLHQKVYLFFSSDPAKWWVKMRMGRCACIFCTIVNTSMLFWHIDLYSYVLWTFAILRIRNIDFLKTEKVHRSLQKWKTKIRRYEILHVDGEKR